MRKINKLMILFLSFLMMAGQNPAFTDSDSQKPFADPEKDNSNAQSAAQLEQGQKAMTALVNQQNMVNNFKMVGYSTPGGDYELTVTVLEEAVTRPNSVSSAKAPSYEAPSVQSSPDAPVEIKSSNLPQSEPHNNTSSAPPSFEPNTNGGNNNAFGDLLQNFIPDIGHLSGQNAVQINQDTLGESRTLTYKNTSSSENRGSLILIAKSDYVFPRRIATTTYELNKKTSALIVNVKNSAGNHTETHIYSPKDDMQYIQQLLAMYKLAEKGQGPGRTKWESSRLDDFMETLESFLKPLLNKIDPTEGKNKIDGRVPLTEEMIDALVDIAAQAGIALTKEEAIKAFKPPSQEDAALLLLIRKIIAKIDAKISRNNSGPAESEIEDFIRVNARHDIKLTREQAAQVLKARKAVQKSTPTENQINVLIKAAARLGIRLTHEQALLHIKSLNNR